MPHWTDRLPVRPVYVFDPCNPVGLHIAAWRKTEVTRDEVERVYGRARDMLLTIKGERVPCWEVEL